MRHKFHWFLPGAINSFFAHTFYIHPLTLFRSFVIVNIKMSNNLLELDWLKCENNTLYSGSSAHICSQFRMNTSQWKLTYVWWKERWCMQIAERSGRGGAGVSSGALKLISRLTLFISIKKMINDTVTALFWFIVIYLCRIDLSSLSIFSFVECFIRHFLITLSIDRDWSSLRSWCVQKSQPCSLKLTTMVNFKLLQSLSWWHFRRFHFAETVCKLGSFSIFCTALHNFIKLHSIAKSRETRTGSQKKR